MGPSWEQTLMADLVCSMAAGNEGLGRMAEDPPQTVEAARDGFQRGLLKDLMGAAVLVRRAAAAAEG